MPTRRFTTGLLALFLAAVAGAASAQSWNPEQQEIWKLEELQWKMSMDKDITWIDKMCHPNISVWENGRPAPQNRASITRWSRYSNASSTILEQEIFPISATITGNVAVVQYTYAQVREDYKKDRETVTGRWTDILIKEGGRWMFIGWAGGEDPKK
jgi:Domain of unknown function (DUF4440)